MTRSTNRRRVLVIAASAAVTAAAGPSVAQPADIRGVVTFVGGAVIPEGRLEIYFEDPAIRNAADRRAAKASVESDGRSKSIEFSLSLPANSAVSSGLQIVARLERADGWLVARGSARFAAGSPVVVTLNAVLY